MEKHQLGTSNRTTLIRGFIGGAMSVFRSWRTFGSVSLSALRPEADIG
nr:MAG TPA: hypothetical protein [Caudoviricetes sp.]